MPDPEIPILNVVELGIIRYVRDEQDARHRGRRVADLHRLPRDRSDSGVASRNACEQAGFETVRVDSVLAPPWTSDWLTDERARQAARSTASRRRRNPSTARASLWSEPTVHCPRCSSQQTERVSEFGSTPCKALYRCTSCLEPFEYFKCI